jgi:predicted nucleic acid-binding protein
VLVTFDSNVWISGLVFRNGNPYALVALATEGVLEVAISDFIVAETT